MAFQFSCHIFIGTILAQGVVLQLSKANIITIHLERSCSWKKKFAQHVNNAFFVNKKQIYKASI